MRPGPRTTWEASTPKRRNSPISASATGLFGGNTVIYRAGFPNPARATATLASPPPNVATNCGDWRKRSNPGGARRSMVSPKETTSWDMNIQNTKIQEFKYSRIQEIEEEGSWSLH